MRLPAPDGRFVDFDDDFYAAVPHSRSLSTDALVALVKRVASGEHDAIMLAGTAYDHDRDETPPSVLRAYDRELARLGKVLATRLGPATTADETETGFPGFRWIVDGVPVVLTAHWEDRELPVEIFVTRLTEEMRGYVPPSLARVSKPRASSRRGITAKARVRARSMSRA